MARPSDNPFAGVNLDVGKHLETDAAKLNPFNSAIQSAGGLIKGYQDQQQQNRMTGFNQALQNAQLDGDVETAKALLPIADTFLDPKMRTEARTAAVGAYDTLSINDFTNRLNQAARVGDVDGIVGLPVPKTFDPTKAQNAMKLRQDTAANTQLNSIQADALEAAQAGDLNRFDQQLQKLRGSNLIDPTNKLNTYKTLLPQRETVQQQDFVRGVVRDYVDSKNAYDTELTTRAFQLLDTNPEFNSVIKREGGKLVQVPPTPEETLKGMLLEGNSALATNPTAFDAALTYVKKDEDTKRSKLQDKFALALETDTKSIAPITLGSIFDKARQKGNASGIDPAKIEQGLKTAAGIVESVNARDPETDAKYQTKVTEITKEFSQRREALKEMKDLDKNMAIKLQNANFENATFSRDDFDKVITEITPSWVIGTDQDNREDLVNKLQPLMSKKIAYLKPGGGTGEAIPTYFQVANAIRNYRELGGWSNNKWTIDADRIEEFIALEMGKSDNVPYNELASTNKGKEVIERYLTKSNELDAEETAAKVRARAQFSKTSSLPTDLLTRAAQLKTQANSPATQTSNVSAKQIENEKQTFNTVATKWGSVIKDTGTKAPKALTALVTAESAGNPDAASNKGAIGLAQVMPSTAAEPGTIKNIFLLADEMRIPYDRVAVPRPGRIEWKNRSDAERLAIAREATKLLKNTGLNLTFANNYANKISMEVNKKPFTDELTSDELAKVTTEYNAGNNRKPDGSLLPETAEYNARIARLLKDRS